MMRYGLAAGALVVVALIAIILIVSRSPSSNNPSTKPTAVKLTDYVNQNSTVVYTTKGKLIGDDQRKAIRISVTPTERRIEILNGYDETVERAQTYANTKSAYDNFMRALQNAGYTRARPSAYPDERGVCPLGSTYTYKLQTPGADKINTWSDSCRAAEGTFAGSAILVRQLFQLQITDYNTQVRDVRLAGSSR